MKKPISVESLLSEIRFMQAELDAVQLLLGQLDCGNTLRIGMASGLRVEVDELTARQLLTAKEQVAEERLGLLRRKLDAINELLNNED